MYKEKDVTKEEAIEIFKSRITELRAFEEYTFEDIRRIRETRTRAKAEMSKKTLELNKRNLAAAMDGLTTKLS